MKNVKKIYLGKTRYIKDGIKMSEEFMKISCDDEKTAELLCKNGYYNQAVYYYIQSMEKYIKCYICKKVDVSKGYFATTLRELGHSLDKSVDFFIEVMAGNDITLKQQIRKQLKENIFEGIIFSNVYNSTRYPYYKEEGVYRIIDMSENDCKFLQEKYCALKKYLKELYVRI